MWGSENWRAVSLSPLGKTDCRFLLLSCATSELSIHMKNISLSSAITACLLSNICGSAVKRENTIGVVDKKEIKSAMRNCIASPCFQSLGLDAAAWRRTNKLHCSSSFLKLICTSMYTSFKGTEQTSFVTSLKSFAYCKVGNWSNVYKTWRKKKNIMFCTQLCEF